MTDNMWHRPWLYMTDNRTAATQEDDSLHAKLSPALSPALAAATPRVDALGAVLGQQRASVELTEIYKFARQLERELAAAQTRIAIVDGALDNQPEVTITTTSPAGDLWPDLSAVIGAAAAKYGINPEGGIDADDVDALLLDLADVKRELAAALDALLYMMYNEGRFLKKHQTAISAAIDAEGKKPIYKVEIVDGIKAAIPDTTAQIDYTASPKSITLPEDKPITVVLDKNTVWKEKT
jgi:hypothetical protein